MNQSLYESYTACTTARLICELHLYLRYIFSLIGHRFLGIMKYFQRISYLFIFILIFIFTHNPVR